MAGCLRRFIVDSRQVAAVVHQMAVHVRLNAGMVQQRSTATSTTKDDDQHIDVLDAVLAAASSPTTIHQMHSAGLTRAHLTSIPLEFLSAGSETSSATLIWILRFVVMNPGVQVAWRLCLVYMLWLLVRNSNKRHLLCILYAFCTDQSK